MDNDNNFHLKRDLERELRNLNALRSREKKVTEEKIREIEDLLDKITLILQELK